MTLPLLTRLLLLVGLPGAIDGCRESTSPETSEPKVEVAESRTPVFRWLPIDEPVVYFNVGNGDVEFPPPAELSDIFEGVEQVGQEFAKDNRIDLNNPYGCVLLSESLKPICFSLFPMLRYNDTMPLGLLGWKPGSKASWPDVVWGLDEQSIEEEGRRIKVSSVDALSSLDGLECIDFAGAGFADSVWDSIAALASSGSLRGLVVVRSAEFLAVRDDVTIPEIKGLAIHVDSAEQLLEIGQAFPNLTYLSLSMENAGLIDDMMVKDTLNSASPHLRALMLGRSEYSGIEGPVKRDGRDVRFHAVAFPESLEWLCMESGLLSLNEMMRYDDLARRLRWQQPLRHDRQLMNRDIEVVFTGLGYAGGGARSFEAFEMSSTARFWRSTANKPAANQP